MIHAAIDHVSSQLNQHLKRSLAVRKDLVVTSNLVALDGTVAPHIDNKLVLTLVKVKLDDPATRHSNRPKATVIQPQQVTAAPAYFDLHLMIAAHFSDRNYAQGLEYLSASIGFFHQRPVFDHASSPDLHAGIERLLMEIENLSISELSNLWSILGGNYLPSALYRMRLVAIENDVVAPVIAPMQPPVQEK